jgi:excisionase family DNA binding protein
MNEPPTPNSKAITPDGAPLLLTIPEACDALRISRWALYQLINKRRLKTVRIKSRRLVAPADLTALVEELRQEGDGDGR